MKLRKKLSSLVVVGALLAALPMSALAKGPEKKVIDYVALGDSLAEGMSPYGQVGSEYPGYAEYLVDRFEQSQYTVGFENFGVSGYTSGHLKQDVLNKEDVQEKIREAEYITIDIGANDLLGVLKSNPAQIPAALGTVAVNLHVILSTIDQLNPNVKVYVMGYYNPFPYMPQEQQAALLPLMDTLNQTIHAAANTNGDTYVATAEIIAENYETYLPNPSNIHLSLEGYQIIAKEFWKKIDKSKN